MRSKRSSSRGVLARRSAAGRCSRRPIRSRFSSPVSQLSTAENCPVTPIAARTAPASPRRSCPRTLAVPASAGIRVDRTFTVVVLPAPFGPSSAKTSPSPMLRSTPSRTPFSPYALRRPFAETAVRVSCLVDAFMPHMLKPRPWVKVKPLSRLSSRAVRGRVRRAHDYPGLMRAWAVHKPGPMASGPLILLDQPVPEPGPGELLIRVLRCGVCRTDLHLAEGDLPPKRPDVTPGHEVVGEVVQAGQGTTRFAEGDRGGVAWLAGAGGSGRDCRPGSGKLCPRPADTGWDRDGGYAEYLVAADAYVHP